MSLRKLYKIYWILFRDAVIPNRPDVKGGARIAATEIFVKGLFDNWTPQYHLPELPRLNKRKIGFNWAGGKGRFAKIVTDNFYLN